MTELLIIDMGFVFIKNFTKSLEILDTILDLAGLVLALVKSLLSTVHLACTLNWYKYSINDLATARNFKGS